MALQNSLFAPTPFAVNKGGTGNSGTLANGQTWIGNGTATPAIASLTGINGIAVTNGSGTISIGHNTSLTNGQLYIGNTGNVPTAATLTAGTNIGITNAAGSITVATTGPASFKWNFNASPGTTLAAFNGYTFVSNSGGNVIFNLPSGAALGDMYMIVCYFVTTAFNGITLRATGSQKIQYNGNITIGGGTVSSSLASTTKANDSMSIICVDGTAGSQVFSIYNSNPGSTFIVT